MAVLFKAGDQAPVMPLLAVVGNAASAVPEQIGATGVNTGCTFGLTVIVMAAVVAHAPAEGVNVYVVVTVSFKAGAQEPVILLLEVAGSAGGMVP